MAIVIVVVVVLSNTSTVEQGLKGPMGIKQRGWASQLRGRTERVQLAVWEEHGWAERARKGAAREAGRGQIPKTLSVAPRGLDFGGRGKPLENLKQDTTCS